MAKRDESLDFARGVIMVIVISGHVLQTVGGGCYSA